MTDPNAPTSPDQEPPEHPGLLFDPTAPLPFDAIEGYDPHGDDTHGPARSSTPLIAAGLVALTVIAALGIVMTRDSTAAENPPELPPMVEPVPGTATPTSTEAIIPIPTATLTGAVSRPVRVAVRTIGSSGAVMADTLVRFSVESGDAVIAEPLQRTNTDGVAATSLSLPRQPGRSIVLAHVMGSTIEPGRFEITAVPGPPDSVHIVSGDRQQGEIGALLPNRVVVQLTDAEGNPVPNSEVRFQVMTGEGITAPSQTRTDSIGRASALWRLGMVEGTQRLTATASDILKDVAFSATAQPATSTRPDEPGPLETNPVRVRPQSYAVGGSHVCALTGASLGCRGGNDRGQIGGNGADQFIAVSAGAAHSCALEADGQAMCWGANDGGQLGDGSRTDKPRPTAVRTDLRFSVLATGASHTCGLAGGGVPLCWGLNLSGQLGDGTRNDQTVPRTVGGGLEFRTITAGWSHTCGLTSSGNAFCWGLNSKGQLGDGSTLDRLTPTLVRGAVETIVAGSDYTCGISRGEVLCWGGNLFGQLGDGTTETRGQPAAVQGLPSAATELAAGAVHACALVSGGRAFCWGQNLNGQLGDGTTQSRSTATAVSGGLFFSEIHAGGAQTCGRSMDGAWYCWGLNQSGQLGDGTRVSRNVPTRVGG